MLNVLFVCTGNTCRSAMAEAIFTHMLEEDEALEDIHVESAGTMAVSGSQMTDHAAQALEMQGIKPRRHKAKAVDAELIGEADLILTMETHHLEELNAIFPDAEDRTHTLRGFASNVDGFPGNGDEFNITDPYRQPIDEYVECASEIKQALIGVIARLKGKPVLSVDV